MAINVIDEQTIDYRVYHADIPTPIGTATVEAPTLTPLTAEITGAGIGGSYESPTIGAFESMELVLNFRTVTGDTGSLMSPDDVLLTLRAAVQAHDGATGKAITVAQRLLMRGRFKETDLGTLEVGAIAEQSLTFEVTMLKLYRDGLEQIAIDKLNGVYRTNGIDHMAGVRSALGE